MKLRVDGSGKDSLDGAEAGTEFTPEERIAVIAADLRAHDLKISNNVADGPFGRRTVADDLECGEIYNAPCPLLFIESKGGAINGVCILKVEFASHGQAGDKQVDVGVDDPLVGIA